MSHPYLFLAGGNKALTKVRLCVLSADRTGILRRDGYPSRHLGPVQMTTDTALGVTKLCVQDGKRLDEIHFVDHPTIKFPGKGYENESVEMPFRYVVDERTGEPILPDGMREHLRCVRFFSFLFSLSRELCLLVTSAT